MTNMFDDAAESITWEKLLEKYGTPEEVAKSFANKETHIKTLEAEAAQRAGKESTQEALDRVLEEIRKSKTEQNSQSRQDDQSSGTARDPANQDEPLEKKLDEFFNKKERDKALAQNRQLVRDKMLEIYGDRTKAAEEFQKTADAFGYTVQQLEQFASENPKVFFRLANLENAKPATQKGAPTKGTVDPAKVATQSTKGEKDLEYYDELRSTNINAWLSPAVQQEVLKLKREQYANRS